MRMAAGMPKEQREGVLETRKISPGTFAAFCEAEHIVLEGKGEDDPLKQPLQVRMQIDIGRFRTRFDKRLVSGLDRLLQAEEWSTLAELQGCPDCAITAKSGVGAVSVEAINRICELLGFVRNGETGQITEKKK
ncbi:MAG: hypothetical protein UY90_C0097G0005 [Candidatus Peregrinibacteria bacterium GW2011_GWA2_54_9]|nr:MAG: hypothetical protein UY90_C0097G0005 [Candidatus Peregrinibacteria bacterium GW2011_GWA2_54_9]